MASAISATARPWRTRPRDFPTLPRSPSRSAALGSVREACHAGTIPKTKAVSAEMITVNARTRQSM